MEYPWPGNVRELKNIIERLTVVSSGGKMDERRVRETLGIVEAFSEAEVPEAGDSLISRKEYELINSVLRDTGGNKTEAARRLGISRPTLHRKLKQMEALRL
jgi:two-component system response regulator HydG